MHGKCTAFFVAPLFLYTKNKTNLALLLLNQVPASAETRLADVKRLMQRGDFAQSIQALDSIINDEKGSNQKPAEQTIEAYYFLAVCQRKVNAPDAAHQTLNSLIELAPEHSRAYQELGHLHLSLQQSQAALKAFIRAVQLNPALPGAWRALCELPPHTKSKEAQRQLAWLESLPAELVSVTSFIHQGKLHKAEALCRQFLKTEPKHPEAMRLLAQLGLKFHILDDAEVLLQTVLETSPNYLQARLDYIDVLQRRQKFPQALEQAKELYQRDQANPGFEISLANALQANAEYQSAAEHYRSAINKASTTADTASVYVALGNTLKTAGRTNQAISAYQQAHRVWPSHGDAYWSLANLKTYAFSESELAEMQRQLQTENLANLDRARIHFALGKAYEDAEEFDRSFEHYRSGNAIKAAETQFDLARLKVELDFQKQHFDANFFEQRKDFGCQQADPIFIVGLPRAGSTLLEQILASHSQVDGTMELANIIAYAHRFNGRRAAVEAPKYPGILQNMSADQARILGETYLKETQHHRQGSRFFIDKMPNNFRHIALIKLILPNAKIIDARRDAMSCCFSGYKQLFAEGQEFSYSLEGIARYYKEYIAVMTHWQQVFADQILHVQHEDVLDDLECQVRRILDFCGLGYEHDCVEFYKSKRAVRTPSSEQVRQPIFRTAVQQWRNYEPHLQTLIDELGSLAKLSD